MPLSVNLSQDVPGIRAQVVASPLARSFGSLEVARSGFSGVDPGFRKEGSPHYISFVLERFVFDCATFFNFRALGIPPKRGRSSSPRPLG